MARGLQRRLAQCSCIGCIALRPALDRHTKQDTGKYKSIHACGVERGHGRLGFDPGDILESIRHTKLEAERCKASDGEEIAN